MAYMLVNLMPYLILLFAIGFIVGWFSRDVGSV